MNMKKVPLWLIAATIDGIVLWLMHVFGSTVLNAFPFLYSIRPDIDRLPNYLTLIVAVVAILIPVAIELWREQYRSHNLTQKSLLDKEWDKHSRRRYVSEPLGGIAVLVIGCVFLPLIWKTSALFYADALYGAYVLIYVFWVSFYRKPINIYGVSGLNPLSPKIPDRDAMLELVRNTQRQSSQSEESSKSPNDDPVWALQLSEEETLEKLGVWAIRVMENDTDEAGGIDAMYLWALMDSFFQICDPLTLWQSVRDGEVNKLVQNPKFYKVNRVIGIDQIIKTITYRLMNSNIGQDTVRYFLQSIPVAEIEDQGTLNLVFGGALRQIFFKASEKRALLKEAFPTEWQVTVASLNDSNKKMVATIAQIYFEWIEDLQRYSQKISEREQSAQEVTDFIFPEVEVALFAKYVLLKVNMWRLQSPAPEDLEQDIDRWSLFGNMNRIHTAWVGEMSNQEINIGYT